MTRYNSLIHLTICFINQAFAMCHLSNQVNSLFVHNLSTWHQNENEIEVEYSLPFFFFESIDFIKDQLSQPSITAGKNRISKVHRMNVIGLFLNFNNFRGNSAILVPIYTISIHSGILQLPLHSSCLKVRTMISS